MVTAQKLRGYFVPRPPAAGGEHDHPLVFEQLQKIVTAHKLVGDLIRLLLSNYKKLQLHNNWQIDRPTFFEQLKSLLFVIKQHICLTNIGDLI